MQTQTHTPLACAKVSIHRWNLVSHWNYHWRRHWATGDVHVSTNLHLYNITKM